MFRCQLVQNLFRRVVVFGSDFVCSRLYNSGTLGLVVRQHQTVLLKYATHLFLRMAIKFGHPREQILKEAKAGAFDMIIMGTKGRSGWADTVLGSVAQRVAGASKVPVLLIKP